MSASDQNSPPKGPRVFVGYRRSDQGYALALQKDLEREFGTDAVFMDVERIGGGDKFLSRIQAALGECNTFLALIGPGWLEAATRLHGPEDFVRMEIAAALASGVRVIPVLLNGAQMPEKKDLPADIEELTSRQAEELRGTRWDDDVRNLIEAIRAPFVAPPPTPSLIDRVRRAPTWLYGAALTVLLLAAGFAVWRGASTPNGNTNGNGNVLPPTPLPTQTVVPTRTPAQTPTQTPATTPLTKCFREFLPEGRWTSINYGDPDDSVVIRREQSKDGPAGILFTSRGQEVGAIRFHFLRYGKNAAGNDSGYYEVEQVIGPGCRPVEGYSQTSGEEVQTGHSNYDWLEKIPLGGRTYDLRLAYSNETIVAHFRPKPD